MRKLLILLLFLTCCSGESSEEDHITDVDSCYNNVCKRCRYINGELDACWPIYSVQVFDLTVKTTTEGE